MIRFFTSLQQQYCPDTKLNTWLTHDWFSVLTFVPHYVQKTNKQTNKTGKDIEKQKDISKPNVQLWTEHIHPTLRMNPFSIWSLAEPKKSTSHARCIIQSGRLPWNLLSPFIPSITFVRWLTECNMYANNRKTCLGKLCGWISNWSG